MSLAPVVAGDPSGLGRLVVLAPLLTPAVPSALHLARPRSGLRPRPRLPMLLQSRTRIVSFLAKSHRCTRRSSRQRWPRRIDPSRRCRDCTPPTEPPSSHHHRSLPGCVCPSARWEQEWTARQEGGQGASRQARQQRRHPPARAESAAAGRRRPSSGRIVWCSIPPAIASASSANERQRKQAISIVETQRKTEKGKVLRRTSGRTVVSAAKCPRCRTETISSQT